MYTYRLENTVQPYVIMPNKKAEDREKSALARFKGFSGVGGQNWNSICGADASFAELARLYVLVGMLRVYVPAKKNRPYLYT